MTGKRDRPNYDVVAHSDGVEDLALLVWERRTDVPENRFDTLAARRLPMVGAVLGEVRHSRSDVPAVESIVMLTDDGHVRVRVGHDSLPDGSDIPPTGGAWSGRLTPHSRSLSPTDIDSGAGAVPKSD